MSTENKEEVKKSNKKTPNKDKETKNKSQHKTDIRVYNVLSYIAILWLVGLLGPDKDNKKVRFHVGQGILVTILWLVVVLINNLFVANIFRSTYMVWGVTYTTGISSLGYTIMGLFSLVPLAFSIIGIINALNENENELPIIGKYAFYK